LYEKHVTVDFYTSSKIALQKFANGFEKIPGSRTPLDFESPEGNVYMLMSGAFGLQSKYIGTDFLPIVRDNYSSSVLKEYDKTVQEFSKSDSDGFISIFSGPAGSGKTHLIRGLMAEIKHALFLYVPAQLVSEFSGPSLITALKELSSSINKSDDDDADFFESDDFLDLDKIHNSIKKSKKKPKDNKIVVILEDADSVLAPRADTDVNGISSLLNITDGILGKILNVRIVATTNADFKKFDKAIVRNGRLCTHSVVGPLEYSQSQSIYKREGGLEDLPKSSYLLADLYKLSKNKGTVGENTETKLYQTKVGF
jgi:SpoVK/Ycf46/Vps4 family AAA+-type ATPase